MRVPRLPAPGQTVLGDRLERFGGGKGANQAVAAARLGGAVSMVGRVGKDDLGSMLLDGLQKFGVDTHAVAQDPAEPTGAALILVEPSGENVIAVAPGANAQVSETDVATLDLLDPSAWLVVQLEIPLAAVRSAVPGARHRRARVLLNAAPPAQIGADLLNGLEVLVVNESEASAIFQVPVVDIDTACQAARTGAAAGVALTVITLGPAGAVFCRDGQCRHVPGFPVNAVDATAAGDAFAGALAVALDQRLDTDQAVRFANAAGAASVLSPGAQSSMPSPEDLRRLFDIELQTHKEAR